MSRLPFLWADLSILCDIGGFWCMKCPSEVGKGRRMIQLRDGEGRKIGWICSDDECGNAMTQERLDKTSKLLRSHGALEEA